MNKISEENLKSLVGNKIFTITFIKKDGSERVMNCRYKVTKHLRGGVSTTKHISYLTTVYDLQANGYRNINLETVISLKVDGKIIEF